MRSDLRHWANQDQSGGGSPGKSAPCLVISHSGRTALITFHHQDAQPGRIKQVMQPRGLASNEWNIIQEKWHGAFFPGFRLLQAFFLSVLSLSPAPVSRWHWAWAECNFTGKYSRGKSYHGMWVADNAHVKCIEVFQFKCICLSLGLSVECEPRSDCQHYPVDAGKELVPSAGWWASAASQECHDLITHGCNEWEDRPVVITLSPHQQCYSGISWGVGRGLVLEQTLKYHMITQYSVQRAGGSLSLSLSLICRNWTEDHSSISIYVKKFNPNHVQTNADKIRWETSSSFPTKFN